MERRQHDLMNFIRLQILMDRRLARAPQRIAVNPEHGFRPRRRTGRELHGARAQRICCQSRQRREIAIEC